MSNKKVLNVYTEFTSSADTSIKYIHMLQYKLYPTISTIGCLEVIGSGSNLLVVDDTPGSMGQSQTWSEYKNLQDTVLSESDKNTINNLFDSGSNDDILDWFENNYVENGIDCKQDIANYLLSGSATNIGIQVTKKVIT